MAAGPKQVNGTLAENETEGHATKLIKKLYGVPNERGGVTWLDECPDYLRTAAQDPDHALLIRYKEARSGAAKKTLNLSSIEFQSPYLKGLIRQVFRSYPGETVDEEELIFETPFYSFFHQWATLNSVYDQAKEDDQRQQLETLLDILKDEYGDGMRDAQNLARNGNITFSLIWTLFPPGCPVFGQWKGKEHIFLVNDAKFLMGEIVPIFSIELLLLDYDGERYGWRKVPKFVQAFTGSMKITALPAVPLYFHVDSPAQLDMLYNRGSILKNLMSESPAYKAYDGPVRLHRGLDIDDIDIFIEGRIMIDGKTHSKQASRYSPSVSTIPHRLECLLSRDKNTKTVVGAASNQRGFLSVLENLNAHPVLSVGPSKLQPISLTQDDKTPMRHHRWTEVIFGIRPEMFCRSIVRGYCLTSKAWAEFETDDIADIKWNKHAFDNLVIPPARKRLLEALVKQQQGSKAELDDFIQGKGQGLIMLLAGPPGTGKTLTAESISDRLQLPLYAVSANQLGDAASDIEDQFGQVLRLAANWDAVLLLDEADAFLEKRVDTTEARDQNKRVAAFLRILEYYKGILILTTNRTVNFDDAFYSRIHLTLPFKPLDHQSRADIWTNLLRGAEISSSDLAIFASENLNGRQIKNIIKMARLLATDGGESLKANHVRDVLSVAREDFDPTQPGDIPFPEQ